MLKKVLLNFDIYPKTLDEFKTRTYAGACVSFLSVLILLWLLLAEFAYFMTVDVKPELYVDTSRGETLQINFDITFPALPCIYLTIDALDSSGNQQLDVIDTIYKIRTDANGNPIERARRERMFADDEEQPVKKVTQKTAKINTQPPPGSYCGSCYGAGKSVDQCCNTCEEVREAYRTKGWAFKNPDGIEQCANEGWTDKLREQKNEGCRVYGHVVVNKIAGNFHFAPGKSFQQHSSHVHDLVPFEDMALWNTTHNISRLSFGKYFPGVVNPLDRVAKVLESGAGGLYSYYIKIIPTKYNALHGHTIKTNQYSVTEHFRELDPKHKGHGAGLPGVFFMYDVSPIMVEFNEVSNSFAHFLTGVCAIIGGVFTVAGFCDSIIHAFYNPTKKTDLI
eukprot:TRINITY_DN10325_c0_g1_i1.p1 TRINITY_DN10325_c0_g1~~TRINITY_DN10325_c0_g1_i1.p1  ORF type:complete len:393 (-),score=46.66 TRINITY_DN10325_c0_g1_i1:65-1243(-)